MEQTSYVDAAGWPEKVVATVLENTTRTRRMQRARGAEEAGFEPAIEIAPYAGLANRCLQPLGHPSSALPQTHGLARW